MTPKPKPPTIAPSPSPKSLPPRTPPASRRGRTLEPFTSTARPVGSRLSSHQHGEDDPHASGRRLREAPSRAPANYRPQDETRGILHGTRRSGVTAGRSLGARADFMVARDLVDQLAKNCQDDPEIAIICVRLLSDCPVESAHDPGRTTELARVAHRSFPTHVPLRLMVGLAEYRAGHWNDAITVLAEPAIGEPHRDVAALLLALAYQKAGQPKTAQSLARTRPSLASRGNTPASRLARPSHRGRELDWRSSVDRARSHAQKLRHHGSTQSRSMIFSCSMHPSLGRF